MSKYLVLVLISLSAAVAILMIRKKNAWPVIVVYIVVYWIVLTVKNVIDYLAMAGVVR